MGKSFTLFYDLRAYLRVAPISEYVRASSGIPCPTAAEHYSRKRRYVMTTERSEHADRSSTTAHTPGTPPRQRIRFPNDSELSRTLGPPDERSPKTGSNPPLPSSILRRHDVVREPQQERRRVRSVDARDLFVANGVRGRAQPVPGPSHSGPGRGRAVSHTGNASNAVEQEVVMDGNQSFDSSLYSDESELGAEGDAQGEY